MMISMTGPNGPQVVAGSAELEAQRKAEHEKTMQIIEEEGKRQHDAHMARLARDTWFMDMAWAPVEPNWLEQQCLEAAEETKKKEQLMYTDDKLKVKEERIKRLEQMLEFRRLSDDRLDFSQETADAIASLTLNLNRAEGLIKFQQQQLHNLLKTRKKCDELEKELETKCDSVRKNYSSALNNQRLQIEDLERKLEEATTKSVSEDIEGRVQQAAATSIVEPVKKELEQTKKALEDVIRYRDQLQKKYDAVSWKDAEIAKLRHEEEELKELVNKLTQQEDKQIYKLKLQVSQLADEKADLQREIQRRNDNIKMQVKSQPLALPPDHELRQQVALYEKIIENLLTEKKTLAPVNVPAPQPSWFPQYPGYPVITCETPAPSPSMTNVCNSGRSSLTQDLGPLGEIPHTKLQDLPAHWPEALKQKICEPAENGRYGVQQ